MSKDNKDQDTETLEGQEGKKKRLYSINASDGMIALYKKPKASDIDVKNKDIDLEMIQDQRAAFARVQRASKSSQGKREVMSERTRSLPPRSL